MLVVEMPTGRRNEAYFLKYYSDIKMGMILTGWNLI